MKTAAVWMVAIAVVLATAIIAGADPLPGEYLAFSQQPMIATPIAGPDGTAQVYFGHDELSTAVWNFDPTQPADPLYSGVFMADDFADRYDQEIVHLRWWGSYMNLAGIEPPAGGVMQFLIAFEQDVPADDPNNIYDFSHPDCVALPISSQVSMRDMSGSMQPAKGMFSEKLVPGSNPAEPVYEYNAELLCPVRQEADTVYWLKIVALVDHDINDPEPPLQWGWHNRDYTIQDPLASTPPAVVPGEHIQGFLDPGTSIDPNDDTPIWHFQDDAVGGSIENIFVNAPCDVHMDQDHWAPNDPSMFAAHYEEEWDGPLGIGQYSKDLAFEIYKVPEPGMLALLLIGVLTIAARWRRR